MPITSSAKKALRQSARKRVQNVRYLNKIRILAKEIKKLAGQAKTQDAKALLPKLYQALDKAAKENTIKKNTASRQKSRITKLLNKVSK
ncbi:30S ribosomal protein S20 [Candidatus Azambacteria bacterium]|nr:30S ribosomal protein S20 [Candidatus Azambacteria bacterium]MBI3685411.1 30S ribosomal protein S20 [Candidatus Azambacteria bacterium]